MNKILGVFRELDGMVSWRKILTCMAMLLFIYATVSYLSFGSREIPSSYQAIIAGIIGFYFIKEPLRNITIQRRQK